MLLITPGMCSCLYNDGSVAESTRINAPNVGPIDSSGEPSSGVSSDTETSAETEAPLRTSYRFIAFGDNIIHGDVMKDAARLAEGSNAEFSFTPMYENYIDCINDADIAFINQETITAGKSYGYSGYPNFNSPQEAGKALIELGFDIVNMASNHMLDKKDNALRDTIEFWKNQNVFMIGGYLNQNDYDTIRIYEIDGIKIAFLSYLDYTIGGNGTNMMTLTPGSKLIIPLIDEQTIIRHMALAKEAADLVFVSMHWGVENSFVISSLQKNTAQLLADCGADVIIGHHTHTVQKVEWLTGSSGNKTLAVYGLGNQINTMYYSYNMVGGMIQFDIVRTDSGLAIENPLFVPTMCYYDMNRSHLKMYMLEDFTEELAASHGAQLNGSFTLKTLKKYVTDVVSAEFLPDFMK